jgi:hypothetical protein
MGRGRLLQCNIRVENQQRKERIVLQIQVRMILLSIISFLYTYSVGTRAILKANLDNVCWYLVISLVFEDTGFKRIYMK